MWRTALLLILVLISCRSAVVTDFDPQTDFGRYDTFGFYPNIVSGLNDLDNNRIKIAIDSLLPRKGLVRSQEPDILVNFYVEEYLRNNQSSIGVSVGGGGQNMGVGMGGAIPVGGQSIEQHFTLDIIDRLADRLIWQGQMEARIPERTSPERRRKHYFNVMERLLEAFPIKNLQD